MESGKKAYQMDIFFDDLDQIDAWNSRGFDLALEHAQKIAYISPVWFDIKVSLRNGFTIEIEGSHNVNLDYLKSIKQKNNKISIVPRIYLDAGVEENFEIFHSKENMLETVQKILNILKRYPEFDGIVFDTPLVGYIASIRFDMFYLLEQLNLRLSEENKLFILSLAINANPGAKKPLIFEKLIRICDKLLVCTYDHPSNKLGDTPISPYDWVHDNLSFYFYDLSLDTRIIKKKLMMGIPFYGYKYEWSTGQRDAVNGEQYLDILRKHNPIIQWIDTNKECKIVVKDQQSLFEVYYPCLRFIQERLSLFEEYDVGTFVWEGGNGLDYFYELF